MIAIYRPTCTYLYYDYQYIKYHYGARMELWERQETDNKEIAISYLCAVSLYVCIVPWRPVEPGDETHILSGGYPADNGRISTGYQLDIPWIMGDFFLSRRGYLADIRADGPRVLASWDKGGGKGHISQNTNHQYTNICHRPNSRYHINLQKYQKKVDKTCRCGSCRADVTELKIEYMRA